MEVIQQAGVLGNKKINSIAVQQENKTRYLQNIPFPSGGERTH